MSDKTVAQKLLIRDNYVVLLVNAPTGYADTLGPLPAGAKVVAKTSKPVDLIQVFATRQSEMTERLRAAKPHLKENGLMWATYPKAGQLDTDLKREAGWSCGET